MATAEPIAPDLLAATHLWMDTGRSVDERVDLLLTEMTLEEKVGQLGSRWVGNAAAEIGGPLSSQGPEANHDETLNVAPMQDVFAAIGSPPLEEASRHGLGHLTRIYGSTPSTAADGAAELVRQQRIVMESSRLGVPAILHEECLTGSRDLPCRGRVRLTGAVRVVGHDRRLVTPTDCRPAESHVSA